MRGTCRKLELHVFANDLHCPYQDETIIRIWFEFIRYTKPDAIHLLGDVVDFFSISKYDKDPHERLSFEKEVEQSQELIDRIVNVARHANQHVRIDWDEGNHEERLLKYIIHNGEKLALIKRYGEEVLTIPYLFYLKDLGITYYPSKSIHRIGSYILEHGDKARKRAGYTATLMNDSRNQSGISGHTHRLAYVGHTTDRMRYWIENGCLCTLHPSYMKYADWQNGFTVAYYDRTNDVMYPQLIPIINNRFVWGDKIFA